MRVSVGGCEGNGSGETGWDGMGWEKAAVVGWYYWLEIKVRQGRVVEEVKVWSEDVFVVRAESGKSGREGAG